MSTPTALVPGPIVMPALSMTLADACSILTGLKTFHFPSGNLWNDAQGALPVWAIADDYTQCHSTSNNYRMDRVLNHGRAQEATILCYGSAQKTARPSTTDSCDTRHVEGQST